MSTLDALRQHLVAEGIKFTDLEDGLKIGWNASPVGFWQYVLVKPVTLDGLSERIEIAAIPEATITADRYAAVADLFNRINFAITVGKWELDVSDGEVRFHIGQFMSAPLSSPGVGTLLAISSLEVRRGLKPLFAVAFGGMPPVQAFKEMQDED